MTNIKKLITLIIVVALLGTSGILIKPRPAQAGIPVFDIPGWASSLWEVWLEPALTSALAATYLNMVRQRNVDWIAGRSDEPPWAIEGIGEYTMDATSAMVLQKVSERYLKGLNLCTDDMPALLSMSLAPLAIPPARRAPIPPCTAREAWKNIEEKKANLDDYVKIAEPQNNFFGGYLLASTEIGRSIDEKQREIQSKYQAGQGYLGITDCKERDEWMTKCGRGPAMGPPSLAPECQGDPPPCRERSPGSMVLAKMQDLEAIPVKQIADAKKIPELATAIVADQLDVAISGLSNRLYDKMLDYYQEKK